MRHPGFAELNMGALGGAVAGSIGGLFAVGIPPAIIGRNLALLFSAPIFALISWILCLGLGFLLGGQVGPRVGEAMNSPRAEIICGALAGLLPAVAIALWSWSVCAAH